MGTHVFNCRRVPSACVSVSLHPDAPSLGGSSRRSATAFGKGDDPGARCRQQCRRRSFALSFSPTELGVQAADGQGQGRAPGRHPQCVVAGLSPRPCVTRAQGCRAFMTLTRAAGKKSSPNACFSVTWPGTFWTALPHLGGGRQAAGLGPPPPFHWNAPPP